MMSMKSLDPYSLPHDHHELIAMIAPRAIIALGNPEYEWLGDESGYKSIMAASEVFKAMGVADHIGYDFTGNHAHCARPATQTASVKTFVNRYLKGNVDDLERRHQAELHQVHAGHCGRDRLDDADPAVDDGCNQPGCARVSSSLSFCWRHPGAKRAVNLASSPSARTR